MSKRFNYRAKDIQGRVKEGVIEAEEMNTAAGLLRQQNLYIVKLEPSSDKNNKITLNNWHKFIKQIDLGPGVTARDLAVFCRQLATMIEAGVPILKALHLLSTQTENKKLKKSIQGVGARLTTGQTLVQSLEYYPQIFPSIFIGMVRVGEEGGRLDQVLVRLAAYFEKQHEINEKLKTVLIYPVLILCFSVVMVSVLLMFVMPSFMGTLQNLNVELPLITKLFFSISGLLMKFWYLILILISVFIAAALAVASKLPGAKKTIHSLLLSLPLFGSVLHKILVARFCRSLGDLIVTGVPLLQALETVKGTVNNAVYIKLIEDIKTNVRQGGTMAAVLGKCNLFPKMAAHMVDIGEQSGSVHIMLDKIADHYQRDVDVAVSRMAVILEPLLLGITGLIVGLIVIAIMLPMFRIISYIHY